MTTEMTRIGQINDFIHKVKKSIIITQKQRDQIKKEAGVSRKQLQVVSAKLLILKKNSQDAKNVMNSDVSEVLHSSKLAVNSPLKVMTSTFLAMNSPQKPLTMTNSLEKIFATN